LLKSTFNAENFIADCVGLSLAISAQFTLCFAARNHEKFTKIPNFGVQGCLRSSMLIKLKSPWPVLVMISNMYAPIYNHFHT